MPDQKQELKQQKKYLKLKRLDGSYWFKPKTKNPYEPGKTENFKYLGFLDEEGWLYIPQLDKKYIVRKKLSEKMCSRFDKVSGKKS